jgi:anti-sigma-K factor RskA
VSDIDLHHLSAAYALDALDPHERAAFEAHYESCEVCRTDVLAFRDTMTSVAASLATPPPPSLKDRVLADIAVTRQLSPTLSVPGNMKSTGGSRSARTAGFVLAAAAAMVAMVVGVVAITGRSDDTYSDDLAHLMDQSDVQILNLENQADAEGAFKVMWSPTLGRAALVGEDLPPAPDDKAYELWLVTPDQVMAMYVLDPATDGTVHRMLDAPEVPTAWAITMEPRAGVPVATGEIMYVAEVPATA